MWFARYRCEPFSRAGVSTAGGEGDGSTDFDADDDDFRDFMGGDDLLDGRDEH